LQPDGERLEVEPRVVAHDDRAHLWLAGDRLAELRHACARLVRIGVGRREAERARPCGEHLDARLLQLVDKTAGADDKDLLDLRPVLSEPPRRDKRRRHHLIERDAFEPQPGKALDVRGSALRGVVRHKDAPLAQPLQHLERLDRPRQQAVLAAPEYAVAVEEEGVVVC
jgi:hypothetical protein